MIFRFLAPLFVVALMVIASAFVVGNSPTQAQTGPPPTSNIAVLAGANAGEFVVSWDAVPAATHYRIGYVNMEVDYHLAKASCTEEWIEAFVYVDVNAANIQVSNGRAEYTVRRLSPGARHAFTVLTSNDFTDSGGGGSVRSEFFWPSNPRWSFLPGRDSLPAGIEIPDRTCSAPLANPTPMPSPTVTPSPTATVEPTLAPTPAASPVACSGDTFDRDDWGDYPGVAAGATATWTVPSDNVSAPDLTMDHHVALKDAHVSGGCSWSLARKDAFSSDGDNLNPTTRSFNSSKGSRTPDQLTGIAERVIDTDEEKCDYSTQHEDVKEKYALSLTEDEQETVDEWLAVCP